MPTKTYATVISLDDGIGTPEEDDMIVGMRFDFAGAAAPLKSLLCNGQAVSRATYAALFAAIGTIWGPGDGLTTFNLPDDRDRHVRGKGAGTAVGQAVGSDNHTLSVAELPAHHHPLGTFAGGIEMPSLITSISTTAGNNSVQGVVEAEDGFTFPTFTTPFDTDDAGGGGSIPTVPASNIYLPCIYAGV